MEKVLVLTPLAPELKALCARLQALGFKLKQQELGPRCKITEFPELKIACAIGGHGKTQFGIQTQHLISTCKDLSAILCVGGGGRLSEQVSVFDVVVGEKTIEHDYREGFAKERLPEFIASEGLLKLFRRIQTKGFLTHFGPIASGDEDVTDQSRARELKNLTGALAVAWEGAGGARAAAYNKLPFLEVRAITDIANSSAPSDFAANLKKAMANVADLLVDAFKPEV